MLNFLPLLLLLSSLPFLTAQISCSTSTFFTNNALKLPNGLIGSPAFNASIETYPNGTTFIYRCPSIDIQIGETTELLDINRLYMSIDPIAINPHRGEIFRFYCLEGEWRYNIQPSLNPESDGALSDFNTVLMNVPNECRAPDYCVRPPKALGLHTQLIAHPPATGIPTFWSANAKVRQENPSLINQEYTYNFTCEPGYILRDGDGNDVSEQIVPLTCSGGQNFYEWDCTIPGAPVGASCRATKRYKCEAIETCDGSIFNNFPLSTGTSGSIPSSSAIYPYNTQVTTLSCNTTYPSAIFDSIHPTSASQPISTSQSMTFTCQRSKVNGDWKTRWVYIVDGNSYDYDEYRLGCYATTQCMTPPSFSGIITSLEPVRFPFPINDVRDYVATCGPNQRMVLANSSLTEPIPVYAPRGLPLLCVGGSLQWDCQSSSNAFPHAISESSCMSRVRCDAGCPLSSIYDKKYNNGMSLPRAINHTLDVDYDVALPEKVIKLNCLNGWFFSNLMDDKVNEMTATCRIDSVTSRPFRWEIFPNTFKKWRCAAPGICIDDPNFNDVGSPRLIPYDSPVGNLTVQDGTQLGIWDYSDPNTKHVSFRAICPLVGYERQPVDPNTGEQDWALGGINITCGNTFDIPNWRCPGLLSSKGDCGNANLWDKAVCIRYFCAPTQDRLKDPRYNSTLTSEDTLRIGDRLPSLASKMFTSTVEKMTQQVIPVGTHIPVGCGDTSYRLYLVDGTNDAPDLGPTGSVFSYLRFKHIPTNSLGWNAVETDGATCAATSKLDTFYQERVPFYIDMFDRQLPWYQYQSLYNTDGYAITYDRGFFSCQLPRCFAPIVTAPHLNAYDSGGKLIPRDAIRTFPLNTNVSLGCSRGYDMWRVYVNDDIPISRTTDTIDSSRISEEMLSRLQPQVSHITSAKTQCIEQVPRARPGTTQIMAFDGVTELGRQIEDGWSMVEGKWFRHVNRTGGIQYGYYECRPQVCTISQNPAPGTIVSRTSGIEGDNITITCEDGWELPPGSNGIATCYSQEFLPTPICLPGQCPTMIIPNAYPLMGRKNDTVNVTCAEGFRYNRTEGNVYTATCQQDQTWSNNVSRCIPVICPDVIAPPHSYISDGGNSSEHYIHAFDNHVTSRVYLTCEAGYEYKDINRTMMECMINGRWNNTLTICVPSTCNKIPQRLYSTLTTSTGTLRDTEYVAGTRVNMTCDAGYKRNDNDTAITTSIACIKDENGARWERAFPNCTAVSCPPTALKSLSSTVEFSNRDVTGTVVGFTCPPKTMLPANAIDRVTCVGTTWTPNKPITCVPKPCPTLSQPDGGRLSATTGLPGATVRVECKDAKGVYKFKQTITCTADLKWEPSLPVCLGSNANVGHHLVISFITFISSIITTIILI